MDSPDRIINQVALPCYRSINYWPSAEFVQWGPSAPHIENFGISFTTSNFVLDFRVVIRIDSAINAAMH